MKRENFIKEMNAAGYIMSERLAKIAYAFCESAGKNGRVLSALLLKGLPGAGKTFFGESFAKVIGADMFFYQMTSETSFEQLVEDINVSAVIKKDADNVVKNGIIKRAFEQSHFKKVVLLLDELDKAPTKVEAQLLDVLNSGRISTGSEEFYAVPENIYVVFTSNDQRALSDALRRRVRMVTLEKMSCKQFAEVLGIEEDHYLCRIYNTVPEFVLSQAQLYLLDLGTKDKTVFDMDLLSQYVEISEDFLEEVKEAFEEPENAKAIADDIFDDYRRLSFEVEEDDEVFLDFVDELMDERSSIGYEEVSICSGAYGKVVISVGTLGGLKKAISFFGEIKTTNREVKIYFQNEDIEKVLITKENAIAKINGVTVIGEAKNGAFKANMSVEKLAKVTGLPIVFEEEEEDEEDY